VEDKSLALPDLRNLELVRRGEEADRISLLPEAERSAARTIEDDRCAEWDRAFTAVRTMDPLQRIHNLPSVLAVSQVQLTTFQVQVQVQAQLQINLMRGDCRRSWLGLNAESWHRVMFEEKSFCEGSSDIPTGEDF
jgi:hypothetical protein